ncbi:MAG TPA: ribonuclease III domain-containing protein [Verrucomicrobiae bacterium]|nr:ribonuclease III domain-containing protein [Verrucomicrobiae bacterium]
MEPAQLNSLVLAYLGDAVYELEVRKYLVASGLAKVKQLHSAAVGMVRATTQAKVVHRLLPELTEEEAGVVRRGRNAKSGSVPKNTDVIDYRYATAFEALIGYWYLKGEFAKIERVFNMAVAGEPEQVAERTLE